MTTQAIDQLRNLIYSSSQTVIFTGAGMSTESGIPDFRGPNGIWKTKKPIHFQDFIAQESMRRESWRNLLSAGAGFFNKKPNRGHRIISQLIALGHVSAVITQNVDGLHQAAGTAIEQVIELHGNLSYARCLDCLKHYAIADIRTTFFPNEVVPYCDACGGIVKVAAIAFGESMPKQAMAEADRVSRTCDTFVVLGSSLTVYPAATFPALAQQLGAKLVIINQEATDLDTTADLVIHASIGNTLSEAFAD